MLCHVCFLGYLGGRFVLGFCFLGAFWYLPQKVEARRADRKRFESKTDGELLNVAVYVGNDQIYHMRFISTL